MKKLLLLSLVFLSFSAFPQLGSTGRDLGDTDIDLCEQACKDDRDSALAFLEKWRDSMLVACQDPCGGLPCDQCPGDGGYDCNTCQMGVQKTYKIQVNFLNLLYEKCLDACMPDWSIIKISKNGINISETGDEITHINIYPNPAQGTLFVEMDIEKDKALTITITNFLGEVIQQDVINQEGYVKHSLSVSDIANGVYFVSVTGDNVMKQQKIVIAK